MKKIGKHEDMVLLEIQNLFGAMNQLQQMLLLLIENAEHKSVRNGLKHYLEVSTKQQARLHSLIRFELKENFQSKGMQGIVDEMKDLLNMHIDQSLKDLAIITGLKKLQQYKISCCETVLGFSTDIQTKHVMQSLWNDEINETDLFDGLASVFTSEKEQTGDEPMQASKLKRKRKKEPAYDEENTYRSSSSTHDIRFPGGRAGISHRTYPDGESRGH